MGEVSPLQGSHGWGSGWFSKGPGGAPSRRERFEEGTLTLQDLTEDEKAAQKRGAVKTAKVSLARGLRREQDGTFTAPAAQFKDFVEDKVDAFAVINILALRIFAGFVEFSIINDEVCLAFCRRVADPATSPL